MKERPSSSSAAPRPASTSSASPVITEMKERSTSLSAEPHPSAETTSAIPKMLMIEKPSSSSSSTPSKMQEDNDFLDHYSSSELSSVESDRIPPDSSGEVLSQKKNIPVFADSDSSPPTYPVLCSPGGSVRVCTNSEEDDITEKFPTADKSRFFIPSVPENRKQDFEYFLKYLNLTGKTPVPLCNYALLDIVPDNILQKIEALRKKDVAWYNDILIILEQFHVVQRCHLAMISTADNLILQETMRLFESTCGLGDGTPMPEVAGVFLPSQERHVGPRRNSLYNTLREMDAIKITKILPGEWLSDDIVNSVTEILCEQNADTVAISSLTWTQAHPQMQNGITRTVKGENEKEEVIFNFQSNLLNMRCVCVRQGKEESWREWNLFCPINVTQTHWVLMTYTQRDGLIRTWDSLRPSSQPRGRDADPDSALSVHVSLLADILQQLQLPYNGVIREQCPQQQDGVNCGVYVLACVEEMIKILRNPEKHCKDVRLSAKYALYPPTLKKILDNISHVWEPFPKGTKRSTSAAVRVHVFN